MKTAIIISIIVLFTAIVCYSLCKIRGISERKAAEIERENYGKMNDLKGGNK